MRLIDKVWLACAIDSEGTIGYYRRGFNQDKVPMWGISCYIGNSDRRYMEKCAYLMGANIKERPPDKRIAKDGSPYKPRYYAEVKHLKAYRIIKQILPYLIIKAEKAKELLALYEDGIIPSRAFARRRSKQLSFAEVGKQINMLPPSV
jgi:hypothetical protein